MSYNLCNLPRQEKYQIQLDYEASFWAYQIKRCKNSRETIYDTIINRLLSEQQILME